MQLRAAEAADDTGACHRAAPRAEPVGSNPPYVPADEIRTL
jgi:hypothetical protein